MKIIMPKTILPNVFPLFPKSVLLPDIILNFDAKIDIFPQFSKRCPSEN
jgi:hypothetical protein